MTACTFGLAEDGAEQNEYWSTLLAACRARSLTAGGSNEPYL
jgi:hypothetical protein